MSVRARPRGVPTREDPTDAHEERNIWNQILGDLKRLQEISQRAAEVSQSIVEAEHKISIHDAPSLIDVDRLQALYREGVKLAEEEQEILEKDQPQGTLQKLSILTAMRAANEAEVPRIQKQQSTAREKVARHRQSHPETSVEAPASPKVSAPGSLQRVKRDPTRSGSVPSVTRDFSVKAEDVTGVGADNVKGASLEKNPILYKGQEVAYKQSKQKGLDGDWISCNIIEVIGDGHKRKYKVQDPEPDDHGNPGSVYTTTSQYLIAIPPEGAVLEGFNKGQQVLAQYPDTTAFYRAEVVGMKGDFCRLRFEGEEEAGKETDVRRRYVLTTGNK